MYLTTDDLNKGIYPEVLQVLSRSMDNVNQAIVEATDEVVGYLSARYDMDVELLKTGTNRNTTTIKLIREIAIYNCYKISNPVNMPESRIQVYKDTVSFMVRIQSGKVAIPGLIYLSDKTEKGSSYIKSGGSPLRHNHY